MQQVKIFKNIESEIDQLESELNKWLVRLQKKGGRILSIQGNIAPQTGGGGGPMHSFSASDVLIIVQFEIDV